MTIQQCQLFVIKPFNEPFQILVAEVAQCLKVEHIFMFVKTSVALAIPDVPEDVRLLANHSESARQSVCRDVDSAQPSSEESRHRWSSQFIVPGGEEGRRKGLG